ncbi:hypothetical protein [Allokutzneria sp. NRRL B-24872]|uniref:hypothetical protein n=1 Tax=Allokutzneria sp. NRRL B-24872 TaxID=1137961 RepID=UPI000A3D5247|nr:hypothetical protein [Allokutzneria sp. NRRL B-24872]
MNEPVACHRCGTVRDLDGDPTAALAWVSDRDSGRTRWLCPACARTHVRDIESKLPSEWWA